MIAGLGLNPRAPGIIFDGEDGRTSVELGGPEVQGLARAEGADAGLEILGFSDHVA